MYVLSYWNHANNCGEALFVSEDKTKLENLADIWNKAVNCLRYKDLPKEIKLDNFTFVKSETKYDYVCGDMTICMSATLFVCPVRSV
jgi:hypothetical protein